MRVEPGQDAVGVGHLGHAGWGRRAPDHHHLDAEGRGGVLANTIVSSPALGAVARSYGLEHVETLSGSKWLSRIPG